MAARTASVAHVTDEGTELVHERHFTREEANALLPQLTALLGQLREAKDELTDAEAHEALSDAAPTNGGGEEGRQVGVAFLEVRRLLDTLEQSGIVLRDIDRGLVDFPALIGRPRDLPLLGARRGRGRLLARPRGRLRWPRAARLSVSIWQQAAHAIFAVWGRTSGSRWSAPR